ncbi:hypothetical protein [Gloeobacter morelensis]|uniref:Uncharacterized protein n=1 Tax=Gloeobacter morelensis MG652769 TaxID=2781736 RepID=A0ABY3PQD2_9CYAN|nr:hypothetical protein [Gloeobacter morelensis]UFP95817.1 hypothetical protein ISF26_06175 [Gloeobacter morelensis MG652769]
MNLENSKVPEALAGRQPTEDELFYVDWGKETIKQNLSFLNDVLRQLLTLNTALIGSSAVFFDESILGKDFKLAVIIVFMFSLFVCLVGVLPVETDVNPQAPGLVKEHKQKATKWKRCLLYISFSSFFLGFVLVLFGLYSSR